MDQHTTPPAPQSGWTLERRLRFVRRLAEHGDVSRACAEIGLSRQSVYKLRRRDRAFARLWNAALAVAQDARIHRLLERMGAVPLDRPAGPAWRGFGSAAGAAGKATAERGFPQNRKVTAECARSAEEARKTAGFRAG